MNKLSFLCIAASFAVLSTSCQKGNDCKPHDETETQIINATIDKNTTYTFALPANAGNSFEITTQALHAAISKLTSDVTNTIYTFTPSENFAGTDKVVISSSQQNCAGSNGCGPHQHHKGNGSCGQHRDIKATNFIINITVKDVATVNKKHVITTINPVF